jgi:hypothetical protein
MLLSSLFIVACSGNGAQLEKEKAVLSRYVDSTVDMSLQKVSTHV